MADVSVFQQVLTKLTDIYTAITGVLNIRPLTSATDTVKVEGGNSSAVKVDGSATTQPISASSLPLPTGAATSAKQPALGTAGSASTDVITVQGISGGTALPVILVTPVSSSQSLTALNQRLNVAISQGYTSASLYVSGTFTGTVSFQASYDSGTSWVAVTALQTNAGQATQATSSSTSAGGYDIAVHPGWTNISMLASAFTSGSMDCRISLGGGTARNFSTLTALAAGTTRVGFMARAAVWTRESTTPVNANLSITGAAKTTFNTTSGTALNTATSYGDKFAAAAGADVAGTLIIEASPDAGTTYYPVASVALARVSGAGNFGGYLEVPMSEATMRGRLLNGGTNQARAFLTTRMLG